MKILGIDPGYDRVGWAVVAPANQKPQVLAYGCVQTKKTDNVILRYLHITKEITEVLRQHTPSEVAIESLFFSKNQKTAIRVSEARGVVIACVLPFVSSIAEYTPNQVKQVVTGYGNADKLAVEKMVRMQLALPAEKIIDDTIDAIAIAFTHSFLRNSPK